MAASPRAARLRRALAVSSTAVALVVVAAACGTAEASPDLQAGDRSAEAGHSHHGSSADSENNDGNNGNGRNRDNDGDRGNGRDGNRDRDDNGNGGNNDRNNRGDRDNNGRDNNGRDGDRNNVRDRDNNGNGNNGNNGNNNGNGNDKPASGLDILGTDCSNSDLPPHDGFQKAPRCVETSFGEVTSADKSPSLLITDAPNEVGVDEDFQLVVSTRNLKRDRFLGAAVGGYYAEASFLDDNGIQRGHFHTACRFLPSLDAAPDAAPEPAFFLATQDNKGGAGEDKVTIDVPGQDQAGTLQCAVWAGDGSHRVPMMERANQTPAFDVVRVKVG